MIRWITRLKVLANSISPKWLPPAMVCTTVCDGFERPYHRLQQHANIFFSSCQKLWSFAALSCTMYANLYLFPVILGTFVQETAASNPKISQLLNNELQIPGEGG